MPNRKLTDLQPGQTYYVQVRAYNKLDPDTASEWSRPFKFTTTNDLVAPKAPSNLTFVSEGTSFIAEWDAPTQNADNTALKDLKGYVITFKNVDNPSEVSAPIFTPERSFVLDFDKNASVFGTPRGNLEIEVKSQDMVGNIGVGVTEQAQNPVPADVTGLTATDLIEAIDLVWDQNTETDLHHYEVYVDVSGAGFTPGPGNLRYAGPNTAFLITTANPVVHYIKVFAVDVFGQKSATAATASETPRTTTSTDGTPPDAPSSLVALSTTDGVRADIGLVWSAATATDIDHYRIRYATTEGEWSYTSAPSDVTVAVIKGLLPSTDYYAAIQSVDYSANTSAWVNATEYPYTTVADTMAPEKPSPPSVATSVFKAQVTHDMTDDSAVDLAPDTEYMEVYADTTAGFTPSDANKVTSIKTVGYGVAVSELISYASATPLYWKVIAVDVSGNRSPASDATLGTPDLIENAYIENATITDAKIASLSAAKLEAGTATINDLFIRSKLEIDDTDGSIESNDFDNTAKTGWRINRDGITINEGLIRAPALEIQDSQNILPAAYTDFAFNTSFYHDAANVPNNINFAVSDVNLKTEKVLTGSRIGDSHLRIWNGANPSGSYLYFCPPGGTGHNFEVVGSAQYIVSAYIKNNLASAFTLRWGLEGDVGGFVLDVQTVPASSGWTRYSFVATIPSGATQALMVVGTNQTTLYDIAIDGVQIERKIGALSTPSPWTPPGSTQITGESIVTGSIRSSNAAAGIPSQPAWSLNTAGNAQFGDALVRGSLVVGAGGDLANSVVKSSNFATGTTGWQIKGDGTVEFNSGTFRGDLNVERVTSGLTTNLKASVGNQTIQTIVGSTPTPTVINTPSLSGQHYGYTRTNNGAGWYLPTTASVDRKMNYFMGPTTDRAVVIQTNTKGTDTVYMGQNAENLPRNATINTFQIGEIIDYKIPQAEKEFTGYSYYSSGVETTGSGPDRIPYQYTHTPSGGLITPQTDNQTYVANQGINKQMSQFAPDYLGTTPSAIREFYPSSGWVAETASAQMYLPMNLLANPYDETVHQTLTFDGTDTGNDLVGTASSGQVQVVQGTANNLWVTASVQSGMYDANYKTPSWLVNWSRINNSASTIYMTNNMTGVNSSTWVHPVHSIRRGKTYILSVFIRTDLPGSTSSGTLGPPTSAFTLTMGLRCRVNTSYIDVSGTVTVQPGLSSQRVSVAITPPAGTPELNSAIMFLGFPGVSVLNRYVAVTHPQVEEKVWGIHSNANIAASNLPTPWKAGTSQRQSTTKAGILVTASSSPDYRYDAYGRYARGNQTYWDLTQATPSDYKTLRTPLAYVDIYMSRDSRKYDSGSYSPYNGDQGSARYRFSEAGLMFPTSFEPYMPAGVQARFSQRVIGTGPSDVACNLFEHAYSLDEVFVGTDIRRLNSTTSYIIDKAGFYLMWASASFDLVSPSEDIANGDEWWWMWKVTQSTGTADLGYNGVHRIRVPFTETTCVRYLNRDDIITLFAYNKGGHSITPKINNLVACITRIN